MAELVLQTVPRNLGQRPGQFDARRPAADDHKVQQHRAARSGSDSRSASSNAVNTPAANFGRVFNRFQTRRERLPFRMAEVTVPRTGRHDQRVVRQLAVGRAARAGPRRRSPSTSPSSTVAIPLPLENRPQRRRDVGRRQRARSPPGTTAAETDENSADRRASPATGARRRSPGRLQPGKAAADNHDAMRSWRDSRRDVMATSSHSLRLPAHRDRTLSLPMPAPVPPTPAAAGPSSPAQTAASRRPIRKITHIAIAA